MNNFHDIKDIKWVWLDLDDTIIDFSACAVSALVRLFEYERLNRFFPSADEWVECYMRHNHQLWACYSAGTVTRDTLRIERFRRPFVEAGADNSTALEMARRYDTFYLDLLATERHLVAGAIELLAALRDAPDLRTGILSNGFKEVQYRKMDYNGITPYLDRVVLSDDIGITKPDIRLFRHAMEVAGARDPHSHIIIGDNPGTDIEGALNAGWGAIWFDNGSHNCSSPDGAIRITSLTDAIPLLGIGTE